MSIWSADLANSWYKDQDWLVGCNFLPSSSINQLEMFQKDTFDIETIKREIGWAKNLGFNTCLLYTSPSPRDEVLSRMPSSA